MGECKLKQITVIFTNEIPRKKPKKIIPKRKRKRNDRKTYNFFSKCQMKKKLKQASDINKRYTEKRSNVNIMSFDKSLETNFFFN